MRISGKFETRIPGRFETPMGGKVGANMHTFNRIGFVVRDLAFHCKNDGALQSDRYVNFLRPSRGGRKTSLLHVMLERQRRLRVEERRGKSGPPVCIQESRYFAFLNSSQPIALHCSELLIRDQWTYRPEQPF